MKSFFVIPLLLICYLAGAQDTIVKKNGDIIKAKITEIGTEEVKFKIYGLENGPTVILKKDDIKIAKVAGQTIIDNKEAADVAGEDALVKKNGETLKVKVLEIGTDEIRFKLYNNPDGPIMSIKRSDIKQLKVQGQVVIDAKGGISPDLITKKDGSEIKARIIEIGENEIKYKLYNNPDGPTLSLKKADIKNIKIDGQVVYEFKEDPYSMSNSNILDKNSSLKFHFFSLLNKNLAFDYEWMIKPGFNWEVGLGIIGPGKSIFDFEEEPKPSGFFIRTGPKFLIGSSSDVEIAGVRYAHPLKGRYIRIDAIFSSLSTTVNTRIFSSGTPVNVHNTYTGGALMLVYGRQYIVGNTITIGWYLGAGYGFESKTTDRPDLNLYDFRRYAYSYLGENFPLATKFGFNVGYIFRTPVWLDTMFHKTSVVNKPPSRISMDK